MPFPTTPGWGPLLMVVGGPSPILAEGRPRPQIHRLKPACRDVTRDFGTRGCDQRPILDWGLMHQSPSSPPVFRSMPLCEM